MHKTRPYALHTTPDHLTTHPERVKCRYNGQSTTHVLCGDAFKCHHADGIVLEIIMDRIELSVDNERFHCASRNAYTHVGMSIHKVLMAL